MTPGELALQPELPPAAASGRSAWRGGWRDGLGYGALGLPLAFVALPLYVVLPSHYAQQYGVPLAWLGALLLAVRVLDATVDPWIGRLCDRLFTRASQWLMPLAWAAAGLLALAFHGLFFPPVSGLPALLAWCAFTLVLAYLGYSLLSILHLGGARRRCGRARIVSWREGFVAGRRGAGQRWPPASGRWPARPIARATLVLGLAALRAPRRLPQASPREHPMRLALRPSFRQCWRCPINSVANAVSKRWCLLPDRLPVPPGAYSEQFRPFTPAIPLGVRLLTLFRAPLWLAGALRKRP